MAHLTKWFRTSRAWSVSASWFPLLFLTLLWVLAAWGHFHFFPDAIPPMLWLFFALGSAAYLLTLAGFVFFCNPERPANGSTRTATALAIGIAMIFGAYAWSQWPKGTNFPTNAISKSLDATNLPSASQTTAGGASAVPTQLNTAKNSGVPDQTTSNCVNIIPTPPNEAKSDNGDPLNLVNVFAAMLGVILAAVALIAQKSAVDAKAEAERARKDILEALDIKIVALNSRLLTYAQEAKLKAEDLLNEANEIVTNSSDLRDQSIAYFLRLETTSLGHLAKFFMILHHWILDPRLTLAADLAGYAEILVLDLQALDRTAQTTRQSISGYERRLRTEHWRPVGRLIENLLILGPPSSAVSTEAEKVMLKLQEVRAMLAKL